MHTPEKTYLQTVEEVFEDANGRREVGRCAYVVPASNRSRLIRKYGQPDIDGAVYDRRHYPARDGMPAFVAESRITWTPTS